MIFQQRRITVNLSPADLPKEGGRFDLPIAVGILAADRKIDPRALNHREFYGELSLGGALRETPKLLPALIAGAKLGSEMILPAANALEASLLNGAKLRLMNHLYEVVAALGEKPAPPASVSRQHMCSARAALPRWSPTLADAADHDRTVSKLSANRFRISPRFAASMPPSAPWRLPRQANMGF